MLPCSISTRRSAGQLLSLFRVHLVLLLSFQSGGNYTGPVNKAITLHNQLAQSSAAWIGTGFFNTDGHG